MIDLDDQLQTSITTLQGNNCKQVNTGLMKKTHSEENPIYHQDRHCTTAAQRKPQHLFEKLPSSPWFQSSRIMHD